MTRFERRVKLAKELDMDPKGVPLHVLRQMHDAKFPKTPKVKGKVKPTGGKIDASMFPPDSLLDKSGRPLRGGALQARVEKLERSAKAEPQEVSTPNPEGVEVRIETLEHAIGQLTSIVELLAKNTVATPTGA